MPLRGVNDSGKTKGGSRQVHKILQTSIGVQTFLPVLKMASIKLSSKRESSFFMYLKLIVLSRKSSRKILYAASGNFRFPSYISRRAATKAANISIVFYCVSFLICGVATTHARPLEAQISVISVAPPRIRVEGKQASNARGWSFRNTYAGVVGLGERIENFALADADGAAMITRKIAPGEYKAEGTATRFSYDIMLHPPNTATHAAHCSWLTDSHGVLMLGDLLPLGRTIDTKVRLTLPENWSAASIEMHRSGDVYEVSNTEDAVFFIGREMRERRGRVSGMDFKFVATGDWAFADEDAFDMVKETLKEHNRVMRVAPRGQSIVALVPFPRLVGTSVWSAETRGGTVILLSGRSTSKTAGLAQLSVSLPHELFHLWVPNALRLSGDYAWFYEGFTLYHSLRAGMRLGYFNFQDYLNAMGRAFDVYDNIKHSEDLSLVGLSAKRWSDGESLVYNKGMLVAFLYDLTLMQQTDGKLSLDEAYYRLFHRQNLKGKDHDGNTSAIRVLKELPGMSDFTQRYIENPVRIDLPELIKPFGLQAEHVGTRTRIFVTQSLHHRERRLLAALGYNDKNYTPRPKLTK